jgi:folate-binding protein YgfZ
MTSELAALLDGASELSDWRAESRAFVESCALVARPDRGAVSVTGERRAEMLNGLLTNQVTHLTDAGRHALLLTAKGRVLTDLRVLPRASDMLLDVPQSGLVNLLATFKKYLPPLYAAFEDASDALRQLGLYGPETAAAASRFLGGELPNGHLAVREVQLEDDPVLVIRNRRLAPDGVELIASAAAVEQLASRLLAAVNELGGRPAGLRALEVARVEAGIPAYGVDISEENLAQETGLEEEAISYDKGCYLGQEVVARVHFRGHVNRHVRGLRFADERPGPGATLHDGDKQVGAVTSAVSSPEFGPIGLGYVRREVEPLANLRWRHGGAEGEVRVAELPFRPRSV